LCRFNSSTTFIIETLSITLKSVTLSIRQGGQKIGKTFAQVLEKVTKTFARAKMPKYLYQSSI